MTLAELVVYARMSHGPDGDISSGELADNLARGVLEILAVDKPCGWDVSDVAEIGQHDGKLNVRIHEVSGDPDEAMWAARVIIEAAQAAKGDS